MATTSSMGVRAAARPLVAAALLALLAWQALASGVDAKDAARAETVSADHSRPRAEVSRRGGSTTIVTMHGRVSTTRFAAVWFEYRTGHNLRTGQMPNVVRTEPTVVGEGSHDVAQRSRTVSLQAPFTYRVLARVIGSTARGTWRHASGFGPKGPIPPPPLVDRP